MTTIGLDPHPASHTVAALNAKGTTLTVKNLPEGFADIRTFAGHLPDRRWAALGAANR